jgi:hypothetical protein
VGQGNDRVRKKIEDEIAFWQKDGREQAERDIAKALRYYASMHRVSGHADAAAALDAAAAKIEKGEYEHD